MTHTLTALPTLAGHTLLGTCPATGCAFYAHDFSEAVQVHSAQDGWLKNTDEDFPRFILEESPDGDLEVRDLDDGRCWTVHPIPTEEQ
jgi:hypothetical protein